MEFNISRLYEPIRADGLSSGDVSCVGVSEYEQSYKGSGVKSCVDTPLCHMKLLKCIHLITF